MEPTKTDTAKTSPDWFDRHFQSIVMGLLLGIVLALSVLWLNERNRRIDAELALEEATMELIATRAVLERQLPTFSRDDTTTQNDDTETRGHGDAER